MLMGISNFLLFNFFPFYVEFSVDMNHVILQISFFSREILLDKNLVNVYLKQIEKLILIPQNG